MKKRAVKKAVNPKKSALSDAIKDLESEMSTLFREKSDLKKNLDSVTSSINVDRNKEKELQEKIAALLEKEAKLSQKKKNLQGSLDKVADKLNKISKIKSEMADI